MAEKTAADEPQPKKPKAAHKTQPRKRTKVKMPGPWGIDQAKYDAARK